MKNNNPLVLCILDGWGVAPQQLDQSGNAIIGANPVFYNYLLNNYPNCKLETSGLAVGLPEGQMGNSEVGHMTIGSGRVIFQDLPRINQVINDNSLKNSKELQELISGLRINNKVCHIVGLYSDGGVHAHSAHIRYLAALLNEQEIEVKLHLILDGRDTPPQSAINYFKEIDNLEVASIAGRYYAMDRDQRYERTSLYYDALTLGQAEAFNTPLEAIETSYSHGIFDEFIPPQINKNFHGMQDGDGLIMANFRADRARQITLALGDKKFNGFQRSKMINFCAILTMTEYSESISQFSSALFPSQHIEHTLGEIIANHGFHQLRIAETEKYAHVTFFFNAGREEAYLHEQRIMIPSPKVATYDLAPAMSAYEMTDQLVQSILSGEFKFILVNYANTDMVGHSGNYQATVEAVKVVDQCLEKIYHAVNQMSGDLIITADHGNAEQMHDHHHQRHTAHTTNPVPFILASKRLNNSILNDGSLADIAPTILSLLDLEIPREMTGKILCKLC